MSLGAAGRRGPDLDGRNVEQLSFLLSSRRTRLSFQRTRMSADRTLMSIMRTSLSLIGFGFTIYQFFRHLHDVGVASTVLPAEAARNFGTGLVLIGVVLLGIGIGGHVRFMLDLREEHEQLLRDHLLPGDRLPYSVTLAVALLLLLLGLVAIIGMLWRLGPLH
jgi:putative membrane protein